MLIAPITASREKRRKKFSEKRSFFVNPGTFVPALCDVLAVLSQDSHYRLSCTIIIPAVNSCSICSKSSVNSDAVVDSRDQIQIIAVIASSPRRGAGQFCNYSSVRPDFSFHYPHTNHDLPFIESKALYFIQQSPRTFRNNNRMI